MVLVECSGNAGYAPAQR